MKKIEKPDWFGLRYGPPQFSDKKDTYLHESETAFNKWFDQHVEPVNKLIDVAVEVRSCKLGYTWAIKGTEHFATENLTYKAYLIGIEPIKKETAEDVLRDMLNALDHAYIKCFIGRSELMERAKRVLERGE